MPFFENHGFRMHYEVLEGLVPRDTICIHGNLASNAWWLPVIESWKKKNSSLRTKGRLILAEWRGCGKSNGPELEKELNLTTLANDYNALLEHLGATSVNVIGHSTGGLIALYCLRLRPDLYAKAVLLDPVSANGVDLGPEMIAAFTKMSQDKELCAAVILGTIHNGPPPSPLKEQIVEDAFHVHPLIWHGVPRMISDLRFEPELKEIPHPVLVLHGEYDSVLPITESERMASQLPNGKFQKVLGQGHCLNVENPDRFTEIVEPFLYG